MAMAETRLRVPEAPARGERRLRVLVMGEIANPEMVSVPLVAWSIVEALAGKADVHLVTHVRNREAIARAGWLEGRDFSVIDTEATVRRIFSAARLLGASDNRGFTILQAFAPIGCWAFERAFWQRYRPAIEAGGYDIVHRLTPMSPTTPSGFVSAIRAAGTPVVVGPLNGGLPWPPGFADRMMREREWLSRLRAAHRLLPGYRALRRDAGAFLVGSEYTLSEVPGYAKPHSFYLPENGIDPLRFTRRRTRRAGPVVRAAFVGRLVPYKCADVLVRAGAGLMRAGRLTLDIAGDGPERPAIEALVRELGLERAVTLHGEIPHHAVQDLLAERDMLVLPSIREFGGGVVLEAMALGVAAVVADYGGPRELVGDDCGIRVPFDGPDSLLANLSATLEAVVADPAQLDRMGTAGRARVEALFTWDRKAEQLMRLYDWVLQGGPRPDLLAIEQRADA